MHLQSLIDIMHNTIINIYQKSENCQEIKTLFIQCLVYITYHENCYIHYSLLVISHFFCVHNITKICLQYQCHQGKECSDCWSLIVGIKQYSGTSLIRTPPFPDGLSG